MQMWDTEIAARTIRIELLQFIRKWVGKVD